MTRPPISAWGVEKIPPAQDKKLSPAEDAGPSPGCEENALCNKEMGQHLMRWQRLLKDLRLSKQADAKTIAQQIESFRQKSGLPVEFYSRLLALKQFSPLMWDSPCKIHQNADKNKQVYVAMSFLKDARGGRAEILNHGVTHFIPRGDLFQLDPVVIYGPPQGKKKISAQTYFVPHGELPVALEGEQLIMPREDEGIYYYLQISAKGDFKVVAHKLGVLPETQEVDCDAGVKAEWESKYARLYEGAYCREIWDKEAKKKKHMLVAWSCQ